MTWWGHSINQISYSGRDPLYSSFFSKGSSLSLTHHHPPIHIPFELGGNPFRSYGLVLANLKADRALDGLTVRISSRHHQTALYLRLAPSKIWLEKQPYSKGSLPKSFVDSVENGSFIDRMASQCRDQPKHPPDISFMAPSVKWLYRVHTSQISCCVNAR